MTNIFSDDENRFLGGYILVSRLKVFCAGQTIWDPTSYSIRNAVVSSVFYFRMLDTASGHGGHSACPATRHRELRQHYRQVKLIFNDVTPATTQPGLMAVMSFQIVVVFFLLKNAKKRMKKIYNIVKKWCNIQNFFTAMFDNVA